MANFSQYAPQAAIPLQGLLRSADTAATFNYPRPPDVAGAVSGGIESGIRMSEFIRGRREEEQFRQAFTKAVDPATGQIDESMLLSEVGKFNPKAALALDAGIKDRNMKQQQMALQLRQAADNENWKRLQFAFEQQKQQQLQGYQQQQLELQKSDPRRRVPLIDTYDPTTGQVTRGADAPGAIRPPKNGMSVTLPDGTVVDVGGSGQARLPMGTVGNNTLDKSIIDNAGRIARLNDIKAAFDPKYLTLQYKAGNWFRKGKDMLDMASTADQAELSAYTDFAAKTARDVNQYLHEMSGAAITLKEADRLSRELSTVKDSPTEFNAKLNATIEYIMASQARLIKMRAQGIQPKFDKDGNVVSFNGVPLQKDTINIKGPDDPIIDNLAPGTLVKFPDGSLNILQ